MLFIHKTYLKYGFSLSVKSWNASFAFSASSSGPRASLALFARQRTTYSATEDAIVMQ